MSLGFRNGCGIEETAVLANAVGACTATSRGAGRAVASREHVVQLLTRKLSQLKRQALSVDPVAEAHSPTSVEAALNMLQRATQ